MEREGQGFRILLLRRIAEVARAALVIVLGALLADAIIVAAVALGGPEVSFFAVALGSSAISVLIAYAFDVEESRGRVSPLVRRTRAWIAKNEVRAMRKAESVLRVTEWLAFALLSASVGPFLTTLVVKTRGSSAREGYVLAVASSLVFSAVWVALSGAGISLLRATF